jgi:hypothetical protein
MADPNAWLDDDNPHEVQQQPAIPITAIRRITPTTEAGGPTEEVDVWSLRPIILVRVLSVRNSALVAA